MVKPTFSKSRSYETEFNRACGILEYTKYNNKNNNNNNNNKKIKKVK